MKKFYSAAFAICILFFQTVSAQTNKPVASPSLPAPTNTVATTPAAYSIGSITNYVKMKVAQAPFTDMANFNAQDYRYVKEATEHVDGLGRTVQTIMKQVTPGSSPKDMVIPSVYDNLGLQPLNYMGYVSTESNGSFKMDPFNAQKTFLQAAYTGEQVFYTTTEYEASSLRRPLKQFVQGNSWAGSGVGREIKREFNTVSDAVPFWELDYTGLWEENYAYAASYYAAGELTKLILLDEAGNATVEYSDKNGRLVLKKVQVKALTTPGDYSGYTDWLCTFYMYNEVGRLIYVIPPKASVATVSGGQTYWNASQELSFLYEYDDRGRVIAKKSPDADWLYMVYDNRDRLVFTQDGNQRLNKKWSSILYDELNRTVLTGIISYPSGSGSGGQQDAENLQIYVNANTSSGINTALSVMHTVAQGLSADVTVNTIQSNTKYYKASGSITFEAGFDSDNSTDLLAEITTATPISQSENIVVNNNPLPPGNNLVELTLSFYDGYDFKNKNNVSFAYSTTNNTKLDAANNLNPLNLPTTAEQAKVFTRGVLTGGRVRVLSNPDNLSTGAWLTNAIFFDENGNKIQAQNENYKGGTDVATYRFDFTGKPITSYLVHNNPANTETAMQTISVKTNMLYDHTGRLMEIRKKINDDDATERVILRNKYDAMSQLEEKSIGGKKGIAATDPNALDTYLASYSENQLEKLKYEYNVRGWLKSINKDYAGGTNTGNWFGMDISFDWGFSKNQFNGNVSGVKWRSAGDQAQRAYGYDYDKVNRLQFADFSQKPATGSGNYTDDAVVNYDMQIGNLNGSVWENSYDANGNILKMKQWGLKLNSSSVTDDLTYTYNTNSNKLKNVIDAQNDPTTILGDFRSSTAYMASLGGTKTNAAVDYDYDANGNVKKDRNKDIEDVSVQAIQYNHLDLPWKVKVKNKGTITYIYDALGNKLEKITEDNTTPPPGQANRTKSTVYLNGFQYENNELKFFAQEQGKVRVTRVSGKPNTFNYDFSILDNLGNVRVVLTDEKKVDTYPVATLEDGATGVEKDYYTIDPNNIVTKPSSFLSNPDYPYPNNNIIVPYGAPVNPNPTSNTTANSNKLYKLNGSTAAGRTGLGITLKVMTGDKVNIFGKSFYSAPVGTYNNNNTITSILSTFINGMAGTAAIAGSGKNATGITLNGSTATSGSIHDWVDQVPNPADRPKAYINWILLDEQFRVIASNSGFDPVDATAGKIKSHQHTVDISQSGYLYVYCSNESNTDVLFDNLQLVHSRGPLVETDEYYPFGLLASGISYKAAGSMEDNVKLSSNELQTQEFADGSGLEFYDFNARMYDAQIGRFMAVDPLASAMPKWSPYAFAFDNPVRFIDPSGLEGDDYEDRDEEYNEDWDSESLYIGVHRVASSAERPGSGGQGDDSEDSKEYRYDSFDMSSEMSDNNNDNAKDDDDWKPLYKKDLITYVHSTNENLLGSTFEILFSIYSLNNPLMRASHVRPNGTNIFQGGFRNTAPDFVGDAEIYNLKTKVRTTILGADWYELKQKSGGLYLSSNEDQIAGHIDNLRNNNDYAYIKYGRLGFQSKLYVVTTADVKYSAAIFERAFKNNVLYEHIHAEYRIVNDKWEFRFNKTAAINQGTGVSVF